MFRNRSIPKTLRYWTTTRTLFVYFDDFSRPITLLDSNLTLSRNLSLLNALIDMVVVCLTAAAA